MEQNDKNVYAPPTAPVADPQPEPIAARPHQVKIAVWLFWLAFVISTINKYLVLPEVYSALRRSTVISVSSITLAFLITLWFTRKLLLGRNWMRVTLLILILSGLAIAPFATTILFHGSIELFVIYAVQGILQLIALWLLFTKPGSDWFRKRNQ